MGSRMDKYKNEDLIPTRSDKNKPLYKQIYNGYDEFENLVVPSNSREINLSELKKEVTSRDEYRERKDYQNITNNTNNNKVARKEKVLKEQKKENEIYDINELLNKAVTEKKKPELIELTLSNEDYLKKLKLDNTRTNIEQVKEMYDEIIEESILEDESLLETANLSLEILSDLKGDNDSTRINPPIKEEELPKHEKESDFYSNTYRFSKKDFEDKKYEENVYNDEEQDNENENFFFKILLLILGIILLLIVLIYFINYFNRI